MGSSHPRQEDDRAPARRLALVGAALALSAVAFDLALAGRLTLFFDLAFVVACLGLAVAVRPDALFTVGVGPPLLMVVGFVVLAAARPGAIADAGDGVVQATVTGLAHHSGALVTGYLLCLATLAVRRRRRQPTGGQPRKRLVSPAP